MKTTTTIPPPPVVSGATPVLGHALAFARDRLGLLRRGFREHGSAFTLLLGTRRCAVFAGQEYYDALFGLGGRGLAYPGPARWSGSSHLSAARHSTTSLDHPLWFARPNHCLRLVQDQVQEWLDALGEAGEMDLAAEIETVVQNATGHAFFGEEFDETIGPEFWMISAELGRSADVLFAPTWRPPEPGHHERALERVGSLLAKPLAERRAHPGRHGDCLQVLIDRSGVADDELAELVLARVFARHDATVGLVIWSIIQLLQHPDYLRRVQSEIARACPTEGTPILPSTLEAMLQLLRALRESARLQPTPDTVLRRVTGPCHLDRFHLPAGWLVMAVADASQLDPEPWPDAHRYDPDRFDPPATASEPLAFTEALASTLIALLLQQFELDLLTTNPATVPGLGHQHLEPVQVRYLRKPSRRRVTRPGDTGSRHRVVGGDGLAS